MSKALLQTSGQGAGYSAGTTRYALIGDGQQISNSVENNVRVRFRVAGTLSGLSVNVSANATSASTTVRTRKNGGNGNQSISIPAATTGFFEDVSNTDTIAAGDYLALQLVIGTGGSISIFAVSTNFAATTGTSIIIDNGGAFANWASATRYAALTGGSGLSPSATESTVQLKFQSAGTLKNLGINISSNARLNTTTYRTRINGADGNISIAISAGVTGYVEDTSNTDAVAVDDLINLSITTGAGTDFLGATSFIEFNATAHGKMPVIAHASRSINQNLTRYLPLSSLQEDTTESDTQGAIQFDAVLSNLCINVTANTVTASSTFRTRINGSNGSQSLSIPASTTGFIEDATNTDTVAVGDDVCYQLVTGAGGTSMTIGYTMMLIAEKTTTDSTKAAAYSVVTEHDTTKSAAYSVLVENDITKAAAYDLNIPTFTASPSSDDFSDLTKTSSGHPTEGNVTFWYKRTSDTGITSLLVRVGSDSSNYTEVSFTPEADTDWHFISLPLNDGRTVGTPVWTAVDYLSIVVANTTSSSIKIDDIRMTANGSFTMYELNSSIEFENARASFKKPTIFVDQIAKALSYTWFIDYERDIHFVSNETVESPFELDADTENFEDLVIDVDTSQLKNRQVVRGGTKETSSTYSQVVEGDNGIREWILKSLFKNLTIKLDDNTSTDTCEASTNTTTINATAHGLATGDWIVNRTRNAARQVTVVNANQFTVLEVTGQTSGDTFSKFATSKTVGVENIDDEASYDYMYNYNEKSIRASTQTETLPSGSFLLFTYNEVVPVRVQVSDNASIAALKALIGGDGIFDGQVITDTTLDSTRAAHDRAQAEINQYSNPIVKISFKTNYEGLESGQTIRVTDVQRGIDDVYLIQRVKTVYRSNDLPLFEVQCASTLFGIIEYFQKLSQSIGALNVSEDEVIDQVVSESVTITLGEVHDLNPSESASESATITLTETSNTATERNATSDPFEWGPTGSDNRWNLNQWG